MGETERPEVTARERRELAERLGVDESATDESPTLSDLKRAIDTETDPEFASIGEAIRSDLTGKLDVELIERNLEAFEARIERFDEVREVGIPGGDREADEVYREVIAPAFEIYDHLEEVGFFHSVEENLPAFTEEHIDRTAHELLRADPLTDALTAVGFDEHEQTALMMNVVNNDTRLSRWTPTREIPDEVEFNVDYVPPLHMRAMGGALLWMKALDDHLWKKKVLITEQILDDAHWRSKAMLAGIDVMLRATRAVARDEADDELTDAQVTAGLIAGSAVCIVNQEELMKEAFWITEEKRKPSEVR
jgi:hypothetical protein